MPFLKSVVAVASFCVVLVTAVATRTASADDDSLPPPRPPPKAAENPAAPAVPTPVPAPTPAAPAPGPGTPIEAPAPSNPIPAAPAPVPEATPPPAAVVPARPTLTPSQGPQPTDVPVVGPALATPTAAPAPTPTPLPAAAPAAAPAATPIAPTPGVSPPTPAIETLDSISRAYDEQEKADLRDVRRRRYESIYAYVQTHPAAKDKEESLGALVSLAFDTESWDRVPARVDAYADHVRQAHGAQPMPVDFLFDKAYAFAKLGLEAQARTAYGALVGVLSLKLHAKGVVVRSWSSYAFWLADIGDINGAKAQWRGLKAIFQTIPPADGKPFMNMADDEIKYLDQVGHEPPAFPADARDLEGRPVSLANYRGKYVLLDFWATWCKPCKEELPNVLDAYRRWHDKGFDVLGIVVNEPQDGAKVREFVAEKALPWRQIHYATGRNPIQTAFGVYGVPYTMLIGPDGRTVRIGLRGGELRTVLERIFERPK